MKRFALGWISLVMLISMYSCNKKTTATDYKGQLTGVSERPEWDNIIPHGMVYIPSGTFHSGNSDQDVNSALVQRNQSRSIQGFFMDDTEVTNNEYRQFMNYVRDSIAHELLGHKEPNEVTGEERIDWTYEIDWAADSEDAAQLGSMFYSGDDQFWGQRELNTEQLIYEYEQYEWERAASKSNRGQARSSFIKKRSTNIYPDTLCWIHDFSYSYNEPMTRNYFWHPAFDDYPVVGVNWNQANAFTAWRTKMWNEYQEANGQSMGESFRLPFEHEWEYAARGGLENAPYPWGGPYVRNRKGCLLANFKPGRGNYPEDGGFYTVRADAYHPNDYGLYNMSGNVAEWTLTAFFENANSFERDMNSSVGYDAKDEDSPTMKRKVIRGGSWKDIAYYLQTGTRHWEYQDTSKSYIGFRCALTFLGRSINDEYSK